MDYELSNREKNERAERRRMRVSSRGLLTVTPTRATKLPRNWRRKLRRKS